MRANAPICHVFLCLLAACAPPPVDDVTWQCQVQSDCGEGYVCPISEGLCRPADTEGRNGIEADAVTFGALLPLSRGPAGAALLWQQGIQAAFLRANQRGGVHGRRLNLEVRDDAHEPEKALEGLAGLTGRRQTLAVLGGFGNHVAEVLAEAVKERGVPFLGRAGSGDLRATPPDRYLFAISAGDLAETAWIAGRLTGAEGVPPTNVAVLAQATPNGESPDAQGRSVLSGLAAAGITDPGVGLVAAGTIDVEAAVEATVAWLQDDARTVSAGGQVRTAVVLGTEAVAAATFVRDLMKALNRAGFSGRTPRFMATSMAGATELARAFSLDPRLEPLCGPGAQIALGVPSWEADNTVARDYRDDLETFDPLAARGDVSFEGYLTGRLLIAALEAQGREINTEVFIDTLEDTTLANAGGFMPNRHHAIQAVSGATLAPDCTLTLER